jgi:SAM-dependent methyltransferase
MDWFKDDVFWERFAPIMFDGAHWAEVPAVADGITRLSKLNLYLVEDPRDGIHRIPVTEARPDGSPRCLDLCCGFGRISLELARRGFSLTGVDITGSYLETAREDARLEELAAEFIRDDVRSFRRPGAFDLAVNLYNSFGYFEDPQDDRLMVQNAFESLKPGGTFFIETIGKEIALRDFTDGEWFERAGFYVLTKYESLDSCSAIRNTWILIDKKDGTITEKTFVHRLYAASELRRLLLETGFASVEVYGDWDERPYDAGAVKLVVLGRKG